MGGLLGAALGLGVAGVDPAGALLVVAALAAGARPRAVLLFAAVVVAGTTLLGTALSLTIGGELGRLDLSGLALPDGPSAALEAVVGAALLGWAGVRLARGSTARPHRARPARRRLAGTAGLLGAGALFALGAALDPTFVGLVVLAGRGADPPAVALAHLLWVVVSQLPLVLLAVAVARGAHVRLVDRAQASWQRLRPMLQRLLSAVLLLVGAVLLLDAAWWLASGRFLLG